MTLPVSILGHALVATSVLHETDSAIANLRCQPDGIYSPHRKYLCVPVRGYLGQVGRPTLNMLWDPGLSKKEKMSRARASISLCFLNADSV